MREFFQNRLARTMPTYWLCNFLALPVCYIGFGTTAFPTLHSLTMTPCAQLTLPCLPHDISRRRDVQPRVLRRAV